LVREKEDFGTVERIKLFGELNSSKIHYCKEKILKKSQNFESLYDLLLEYPEWKKNQKGFELFDFNLFFKK